MTKIETVLFLYQPPKILLGMKKLRFGKGKYNGFGGGVENGESLKESVVREVFEEVRIKIINPEIRGKLLFQFQTNEEDHLVYSFMASEFQGIPKESDEMKPIWFDIKDIPYENMWSGDKYWLPLMLSGKKFEGNFEFDEEFEVKLNYKLNIINEN